MEDFSASVSIGILLVSVFFVYYDASKNNIGKIPDEKGFFNLSAGMWTIGTLALWILIFPAYILSRKVLIEKAKNSPQASPNRNLKLGIIGTFVALPLLPILALGMGDIGNTGTVNMVRTGYLEIDKSLTVGQAFGNYKYFESVKWDSFKTENGRAIVQVECLIDLDKHPEGTRLKKTAPSWKILFQWRINIDDTFEIQYAGLKLSQSSGEETEKSLGDVLGIIKNLRQIYNNEPLS